MVEVRRDYVPGDDQDKLTCHQECINTHMIEEEDPGSTLRV